MLQKHSFRRKILEHATELRQEVIPACPEVLGRALYLQGFLKSRQSWSTLNNEPADLNGVEAWLEDLADKASEALGGILNVEDLRCLSHIHNRLEWCSISPIHKIVCKGMPYSSC